MEKQHYPNGHKKSAGLSHNSLTGLQQPHNILRISLRLSASSIYVVTALHFLSVLQFVREN